MNDIVKKVDQPVAQVQSLEQGLLPMIERLVTDPNTDLQKLEKMLDLQERIIDKNSQAAFNTAMTEAQSKMGRVSADAHNKQTRSNYATYGAIDRAIRPVYTDAGFALSFDTDTAATEGCIRVLCHVSHNQGHTRTYRVDMPCDGKGAKGGDVMTKTHAAGAGMQYGMRYLVKLIFNIAIGDDDDGNTASAPRQTQPAPQNPPMPAKKFDDNFAAYQDGIEAGRTSVEQVITTLSTKYTLTEAQLNALKEITPCKK